MKKICQYLAILIVCLLIIPVGSSKAEPKTRNIEITVGDPVPIVDGIKQSLMDYKPLIMNNRIMAAPRLFSEIFGFKIDYEYVTKTLTLQNSKTILVMTYNSNTAIVNGKEVQIDAPYLIRYGRSVVPVRFICETFGATVSWDPILHKATIVYEFPED